MQAAGVRKTTGYAGATRNTKTLTFTGGAVSQNTTVKASAYGLGVGAGAGSQELSNGSYTVIPATPKAVTVEDGVAASRVAVTWTRPDIVEPGLVDTLIKEYKLVFTPLSQPDLTAEDDPYTLKTDDDGNALPPLDDADEVTITVDPKNLTDSVTATGSTYTYLFTDELHHSTVYQVTIRAIGVNGEDLTDGVPYEDAKLVTPTVPGPVTDLRVDYSPEDGSGDGHLNFTVKWNAPENLKYLTAEMAKITRYRVAEDVFQSASSGMVVTNADNLPGTIYEDNSGSYTSTATKGDTGESLVGRSGYKYVYLIYGINQADQWNRNNTAMITVVNPKVPMAPADFAIKTRLDGDQITFTWNPSQVPSTDVDNLTEADGSVLYYIPHESNNDASTLQAVYISGRLSSQYTLTLPERETWDEYDFWLVAVNDNSRLWTALELEGKNTGAQLSLTAENHYGVPEAVAVSAGQTVYTAWEAAIADAYEVKEVEGEAYTYTLGDLDIDRISGLVAQERALTVPMAVTDVTAVTNDKTHEALVQWTAPADYGTENGDEDNADHEKRIVQYNIYVQQHEEPAEGGTVELDLTRARKYTVTVEGTDSITDGACSYVLKDDEYPKGLVDGWTYDVFVSAVNGNPAPYAESPITMAERPLTPRRVPDAVTGLGAVSRAGSKAVITWNTPKLLDADVNGYKHDQTGGDPITRYTITTWTDGT